eukprot:jgi/Pico_ML_1/55521/g1195.t1
MGEWLKPAPMPVVPQVDHGDRVVAIEAVSSQDDFQPRHEIFHAERIGEMPAHDACTALEDTFSFLTGARTAPASRVQAHAIVARGAKS